MCKDNTPNVNLRTYPDKLTSGYQILQGLSIRGPFLHIRYACRCKQQKIEAKLYTCTHKPDNTRDVSTYFYSGRQRLIRHMMGIKKQ